MQSKSLLPHLNQTLSLQAARCQDSCALGNNSRNWNQREQITEAYLRSAAHDNHSRNKDSSQCNNLNNAAALPYILDQQAGQAAANQLGLGEADALSGEWHNRFVSNTKWHIQDQVDTRQSQNCNQWPLQYRFSPSCREENCHRHYYKQANRKRDILFRWHANQFHLTKLGYECDKVFAWRRQDSDKGIVWWR